MEVDSRRGRVAVRVGVMTNVSGLTTLKKSGPFGDLRTVGGSVNGCVGARGTRRLRGTTPNRLPGTVYERLGADRTCA